MPSENRKYEVVDDQMAEVYRKKTPAERVQIAFGLWTSTRKMLVNLLRSQHQDWDEKRILEEVARRMSGGSE